MNKRSERDHSKLCLGTLGKEHFGSGSHVKALEYLLLRALLRSNAGFCARVMVGVSISSSFFREVVQVLCEID